MTGLFPGFLFPSTGLNRASTPTSQGTMLSQKERNLDRVHFNDRPWPKSTPVSSVYDACNSSTCLIILNNKMSGRPKGSRLRGQTDITGDIVKPDPDRHAHQAPDFTQFHSHRQCTELHHRELTPLAATPTSVRGAQYSPRKISDTSRVNPTRHASCHSPQQQEDMTQRQASPQRAQMRTSIRGNRPVSSILGDSRLSRDDRVYLGSIADAYSNEDIWRGKMLQFQELCWHAISQGGCSLPELLKYSKYMLKPNAKSHTTSKNKRGKSAHERRTATSPHVDADGPRSNTDRTHQKSAQARSTYKTDTTPPQSKTTTNYNMTLVQKRPGKVRSLSVATSRDSSLLSLMLGMSDDSSKSRSSKSRQSDKIKAKSRIEETEQNNVAEEDESYDIQPIEKLWVDKKHLESSTGKRRSTRQTNGDGLYLQQRTSMARNAEEEEEKEHKDVEENDTSEYTNDKTEYLGNQGNDVIAHDDVTSARENKINSRDTVPDLNTEKHVHGTDQLHTSNEETEENSSHEFSGQVYQKHGQKMSEFDDQQTEEVEQPHKQQIWSQEGENDPGQSVSGDKSLAMAYGESAALKEGGQWEIDGENRSSDSASVPSDGNGVGGGGSTTVFQLDRAPGRSDESNI